MNFAWLRSKLLAGLSFCGVCLVFICSCSLKYAYDDVYDNPVPKAFASLYLDLSHDVNVGFFSNERCKLGRHGTRVKRDYTNSEYVVDGYQPKHTPVNKMQGIYIDVNVPQVVSLHYRKRKGQQYASAVEECIVTFQFTPQENHNYVALFEMENQQCHASVMDLTRSKKLSKLTVANGLTYLEKPCDLLEYHPE